MKEQNEKQAIEEMAKTLCEDCAKSDPCSLYAIGGMCNSVREQATAMYNAGYRKQSEWISVSERLPDCEYGSETEALLFRLKTGSVEAGYFGTGGRFRDKYFRCYHHSNEGWDAKDVTHWMPLPDAPKNP